MASGTKTASDVRPLKARPGAQFTCFSDGLCCTDIHALGPLTRGEARAVRALVPDSVNYHSGIKGLCMRPGGDGTCAQREAGLCGVHKHFGPEAKPSGCRRFPYGLLSTPEGGRITTEHRCPCRTLGERPPIRPEEAERSLLDGRGRLEIDHWAPARIPMSAGRFAPFARYREIEAEMISRLLAGECAEEVLGAEPLPPLHTGSWPLLIAEFFEMKDETAGGAALQWFGDALLHLAEGHLPPVRPRPWAPAFEKAIARSPREVDPDVILNDWVADDLWMMRWLDWDCTFDVARAEIATRVTMIRHMVDVMRSRGIRGDQAAAEAVMIVEIGACSDQWAAIVDAMANDPSPATRIASRAG